ncbi:rab1 (small gtp-binding protein rab1, putative) [Trypanosoma equiperdum]|uniref:Rab1 (Small gtp-binding protein rab1, putative) n=1 Tax=Trypanosoma equiperdum TaxID=5694 RepID=A0A1G4IHB1_TRYEQ|nr:rab1 (small gtp-binding protein rab1, putative) [Trypanosoma equiperdum]
MPAPASDVVACAICLEQWSDPVELLPCTHIFCRGCVSTATVCPICRAEVTGLRTANRYLVDASMSLVKMKERDEKAREEAEKLLNEVIEQSQGKMYKPTAAAGVGVNAQPHNRRMRVETLRSMLDYIFKIILVGDSYVGKTRFLKNLVGAIGLGDQCVTTLSVDVVNHYVIVDGKTVQVLMYDTCGQERFRAMTAQFYRDAHGAIMVYDTTQIGSFDNIEVWFSQLNSFGCENTSKILVGNKCDLPERRAVEIGRARALADKLGVPFIETSAMTGAGVAVAVEALVRMIMRQQPVPLASQWAGSKSGHRNAVNLERPRRENGTGRRSERSQRNDNCCCQ